MRVSRTSRRSAPGRTEHRSSDTSSISGCTPSAGPASRWRRRRALRGAHLRVAFRYRRRVLAPGHRARILAVRADRGRRAVPHGLRLRPRMGLDRTSARSAHHPTLRLVADREELRPSPAVGRGGDPARADEWMEVVAPRPTSPCPQLPLAPAPTWRTHHHAGRARVARGHRMSAGRGIFERALGDDFARLHPSCSDDSGSGWMRDTAASDAA